MSEVAREALEIAVPVHGDEVNSAPGTRRKEALQPLDAGRSTTDARGAELDAVAGQRLDVGAPELGGA